MREFSEQEIKILKQLVKNPRASDNQISKIANVPVMTVNRKRKLLEEEGILNYYVDVYHGDPVTKVFDAVQLYTIKLKEGVTKEQYIKAIVNDAKFKYRNGKYHANSFIGEKDGHMALIITLEAENHSKLMEIFNGEIIPTIKERYGEDCIDGIETVRLDLPLRLHHNYMPLLNIEKGVIKKGWDDESIYIC